MDMIFITFRSITLAQRGERTLRTGGVDCALMRTPKWMENKGCGYCLRLRAGNESRAVSLLARDRVPYNKIYPQNADGSLEERSP